MSDLALVSEAGQRVLRDAHGSEHERDASLHCMRRERLLQRRDEEGGPSALLVA